MKTPETSRLFTRWRDPQSGVESLVLTGGVAPVQQTFYYTNQNFTSDGRFLWIYCSFPPGGNGYGGPRQLAVIDFESDTIRHCPETLFDGSSPFADLRTGEVYWCHELEIWKLGPLAGNKPELVATFPKELAHNRRVRNLATHLSLSADGKSFAIDAQFPREWIVGDISVDGTNSFRLWQTFDRCYNHAMFSPTDPDLILMAQDGWADPITGETGLAVDRLWTIRRGEKARAILPDDPLPSANRGHEWWDADGQHVWFLDYSEGPKQGTKKININTGKIDIVWPNGRGHSHCDRAGKYLVGDIVSWPADAWRVAFFNVVTGNQVSIVTQLPPCPYRGKYHVHPHPQFCQNDKYICYSTNVFDKVDVAIVSVGQLIERTH